jgi:hypothetical protein
MVVLKVSKFFTSPPKSLPSSTPSPPLSLRRGDEELMKDRKVKWGAINILTSPPKSLHNSNPRPPLSLGIGAEEITKNRIVKCVSE